MIIHYPGRQQKPNPLFSRLTVEETMRRRVTTLGSDQTIAVAIRTLTKHKINAVLIADSDGIPTGVVTKTEIMGAYYATLPVDTLLSDIMGSPVIQCSTADTLESALTTMQRSGFHRLYVIDDNSRTVGTLAYPDIVGKLYKYCCNCDFSLHKKTGTEARLRHTVGDVMTPGVETAAADATIMEVIEKLSSFHFGALLLVDGEGGLAGVISKTDLALAYGRGVTPEESAASIMKSPVQLCRQDIPLEEAIRLMVFTEISRLFVYGTSEKQVCGVLSLSDAARARSGSCQACSTTRIQIRKWRGSYHQ